MFLFFLMRPVCHSGVGCLTETWQKNKQEVCSVLYGLFLWHSSLGKAGLSWEPVQTKHAHCSNLNLSRKLLVVKWKILAAVSLNERGFLWDTYANRCRPGSRGFVLGSHSLNHLQSLSMAASSHSLSPTSPVPRTIIVRVCWSRWGRLHLLWTQRKSNAHADAKDGKTTRDDMETMLPAPHPV